MYASVMTRNILHSAFLVNPLDAFFFTTRFLVVKWAVKALAAGINFNTHATAKSFAGAAHRHFRNGQ
jgi:hypothetical protein